ncbi:MAG: hypothetical protein JO316_18415 [Abitibacteriaceae bacterium]|nr:hypothetical protein [Abditibacteriaceae bacterium]
MREPKESWRKVAYDLRPAKQVERRMLLDTMQMLSLAGFHISEYQYTGFGSIYFVDFILFHKLLGIHRLLSVEISEKIEKRVNFNKPFDCVDILIKPIGDVIPTLSPDRKHFLWLDYDTIVNSDNLSDILLATTYLTPESLLLITVDVEPPGEEGDGPRQWRAYFREEAEPYLGSATEVRHYAKDSLPRINIQIIEKAIKKGLTGRSDVEFLPLFNFLYADGHQMLTIGGMIGSKAERRRIEGSRLIETDYIRLDLSKEPFIIKVPNVTRKERLHLDSNMPCSDTWETEEFEIPPDDLAAYSQIYRFFPAYAELLL